MKNSVHKLGEDEFQGTQGSLNITLNNIIHFQECMMGEGQWRQEPVDSVPVECRANNTNEWNKWQINIRPCNNINHVPHSGQQSGPHSEGLNTEDSSEHDSRSYDEEIQLCERIYSYATRPYHWNFYYHDRHDRKSRHNQNHLAAK